MLFGEHFSTSVGMLAQQTYMLKVFHAIQMQITHSLRYATPDRSVNFFFLYLQGGIGPPESINFFSIFHAQYTISRVHIVKG